MIRRISKNNDYLDIVMGCPTGILDDIYSIRYFISGHPEKEIEAIFERSSRYLEVVLPSSDLKTLGNGILVRKSLYKKKNDSYPDGYYNLEFVESLDIWLGDEETDSPIDPEYVTESELVEILAPYAETSWVEAQGYLTEHQSLDGYATQNWVQSQGYITSAGLSGLATQSWVLSQNYLNSQSITGYATENWVSSQQFATQSWVSSQGYLTEHQSLDGYATQSWVTNQGYITSIPDTFATMSWVEAQNYLTEHQDLSNYALKSEIPSLDGYATQSWVESKGYVTVETLPEGIATQSWVQSQGYLTEHQSLDGYATQSWATSQFLEESKVWTGTQSQWDALTPSQQATYTIALITE